MRLEFFRDPSGGLWVDEFALGAALKEGEAAVNLYGGPSEWIKDALSDAFRRLVWHNGLRIRMALAREMKWLGIALLFCWLPIRHWLEPKLSTEGYFVIVGLCFVMVMGTLLEIIECIYRGRGLERRFDELKITTVRFFNARPRPPRSSRQLRDNGPRLKFWGGFLVTCLLISCIVPVSSSWVVIHPLFGQRYVAEGPTLIRPLSSWYVVPHTHQATIYSLLKILEETNTVLVFEVTVEWTITEPLHFDAELWQRNLDAMVAGYITRIYQYMDEQLAADIPDEDARLLAIIFLIQRDLDYIAGEIGKMPQPAQTPMRVVSWQITSMSWNQYVQYYRRMH